MFPRLGAIIRSGNLVRPLAVGVATPKPPAARSSAQAGKLSAPPPKLSTPQAVHHVLPSRIHAWGEQPDLSKLSAAQIVLPSFEKDGEDPLAGWEKIPWSDDLRSNWERLRLDASNAAGLTWPLGAAEVERIHQDFHHQQQGAPADSRLARGLRIQRCVEERADVYWDPATGKVAVREKSISMPAGIRAPDPVRGVAALKGAALPGPRAAQSAELVGMIAEVYPLDAVQVLAQTRLKVESRDPSERSGYLLTRLGGLYDGVIPRPVHDAQGRLVENGVFKRAYQHVSSFLQRLDGRALVLCNITHEVAHALDVALGENQQPLSASAEWKDIFARSSLEGRLQFPSGYAAESPDEFFAECTAMFLGTHIDINGYPQTRADLQRLNPDAYDFMVKVFRDRVPAVLAGGKPQSAATYQATFVEAIDEAVQGARSSGSAVAWLDAADLAMGFASIYPGKNSFNAVENIVRQTTSTRDAKSADVATRLSEVRDNLRKMVRTFENPLGLKYPAYGGLPATL